MKKNWTYFAILVAALFPSLVTWVYFDLLADEASTLQQAAYGAGKVLQFAFPLVWVLWIAREKLRPRGPTPTDCGLGLVTGLAIMFAMLALYHFWLADSDGFTTAKESILAKISGFGIDTWWKYAALGSFYALVHSLLEEYYWRWFVFGQLQRVAPLWPAIVVSSLAFTVHHVLLLGHYFGYDSPLTWVFSLGIAIGGAIWAWMYHRSGALWGAWLSHLLVDTGIFLIGYNIAQASLV